MKAKIKFIANPEGDSIKEQVVIKMSRKKASELVDDLCARMIDEHDDSALGELYVVLHNDLNICAECHPQLENIDEA